MFAFLKRQEGSALVENVIILPLLFIIIFSIIVTSFIIHDRSTVEAAAKRGAIYAARCVSDPQYARIKKSSGAANGALEVGSSFDFSEAGDTIRAYRYLGINADNSIESNVVSEVKAIVDATRIPWRKIDIDDIHYTQENKILYQNITVSIDVTYPLPKLFGAFGMDDRYTYTVSAVMSVNDPDEFIRNADLVVDIITTADEKLTGGKLGGLSKKLESLAAKIVDWFAIKN